MCIVQSVACSVKGFVCSVHVKYVYALCRDVQHALYPLPCTASCVQGEFCATGSGELKSFSSLSHRVSPAEDFYYRSGSGRRGRRGRKGGREGGRDGGKGGREER